MGALKKIKGSVFCIYLTIPIGQSTAEMISEAAGEIGCEGKVQQIILGAPFFIGRKNVCWMKYVGLDPNLRSRALFMPALKPTWRLLRSQDIALDWEGLDQLRAEDKFCRNKS